MSDSTIKKYEPHFWKIFIMALALLQIVIGFLAKDIYSKVNNGVFVRKPAFLSTISELHERDENLRRELCDRLMRIEKAVERNNDLILERLRGKHGPDR